MSNRSPFGYCLALICFLTSAHAQVNTKISHLSEKDGLSYRWVFDITQDENGFLWFATYEGLNRYDGTQFITYKHSPADSNTISSDQILHVAADADGGIWTYGLDLVLNRIDQETGSITRFRPFHIGDSIDHDARQNLMYFSPLTNGDFIILFQAKYDSHCSLYRHDIARNTLVHQLDIPTFGAKVPYFSEREDGKLWLWGMGIGYFLVDLESEGYKHFPIDGIKTSTIRGVRLPIDENMDFWYPRHDSGNEVNPSGALAKFKLPAHMDTSQIDFIKNDNLSNIWIKYGRDSLYRFNIESRSLEVFYDPVFGETMDHRSMRHFYTDWEGASWYGHFYGADRITNRPDLFDKYLVNPQSGVYTDKDDFSAREIIELNSQSLLVKRSNYDLHWVDLTNNETSKLERRPKVPVETDLPNGVQSMLLGSDGYLWTTQRDYLLRTDLVTGLFDVFRCPRYVTNDVAHIFQDRSGTLWWCGVAGNFIFDKQSGQFNSIELDHPIDSVHANFSYSSYDAAANAIYGTWENGIFIINCDDTSSVLLEVFSEKDVNYNVTAILKWKNEFWLSTDQGLVRYHPQSRSRVIYTMKDGLASDMIYSALGSGDELWLSTHNGLCQFNPTTKQVTTYGEEHGIPSGEFNRWSYLHAADGRMYFGGLNGVIGFDPDDFVMTDNKAGYVNLVEYSKYNSKTDNAIAVQRRSNTPPDRIVLNPYERTISFRYMLSIYEDVEKNQYLHYLEGLEPEWRDNGNYNEARYIQIPPGEYTFRVKAAGPTKVPAKNELAIQVVVMQYWFLRWWAIATYVVLGILATALFYRFQLNRRLDKREADKMRELQEIKSRMYTNIMHEFRTPLTVILGMNDAAKAYTHEGEVNKVLHANEMIDRSGKSLLDLVNQILDLSKIEAGMLDVHNGQADIIAYLKYRLESFQSFAAEKEIDIHFEAGEDRVVMDFDSEKISHIVNNLLSNAIKFTPANGSIIVSAKTISQDGKSDNFVLKVRDTGYGIEEDAIEHIFERFYQIDEIPLKKEEGSGIGLSLVKELVRLLDGQIEVRSEVGVGTEFTVILPITNNAPMASKEVLDTLHLSNDRMSSESEGSEIADESLPLVLIVEDNADVKHYIKISVNKDYRTIFASNGNEGIDMAVEFVPDIIISDVMMPEKDGYELCQAVKADERTSHIPVILLTAKADQDSKLEGLGYGADVYLAKPFDQKELLIRLKNLMALRTEIQKRYAGKDFGEDSDHPPTIEDAFLLRIRSIILGHLEDEEFGIPQLCKAAHLSRSQLHRKLVAITGQSTSHLIRKVQMEKAGELLTRGSLNVGEVAFHVGFKTQAHFSRVFSEHFGVSPSEYKS